jgi:AcrR family transcriptional regulator
MQPFVSPGEDPSDTPQPGTRRPGGRTAHNRSAVFSATLALLAERGFADLTIDAIAAAAGVHKTTVYRRWRSTDRLVAAAFTSAGESLVDVTDTGDIDRDARTLARSVVRILRRPEVAAAVRGLVAGAPADARQHIAHQYWASRVAAVGPLITRAIVHGQLPVGTDPRAVIEAIAAPLYFRVLVSIEPLTRTDADRAAQAALAAARGGVFVRRAGRKSS